MLAPNLRPKPCTHCGSTFTPVRQLQAVCGVMCAKRKVAADRKAEKQEIRRRKEAIKTIPQLIAAAQVAFNAFIRERDRQAGHACISSGRPLDWTGNAVDAGHYRSTGAASHLRFNEDNCHAQSKHDNQHLAGNAVDYRLGLIQRIGLARVEALEANNVPHKWQRDELITLKTMYARRARVLKESQQ